MNTEQAGKALADAATKVASHINGSLPTLGNLRDNDASRAALGELLKALAAWNAREVAEPVADIDGPDTLRISKSGYSLRVGWGDDKRIIAVAPGTPQQHYRADQKVTEQWLADAERLCDGWNRVPAASPVADAGMVKDAEIRGMETLNAAIDAAMLAASTKESK